ncbi:MAG: CocE/NonD family hydrolase, partial [Acidobacteria bacterium]|nr:CocE/NonD family hydrolase [Acidobacteriota bacterium]
MGSPEPFQVAVFKDLMIPMRDGVRLAADIYRPARNGEVLPGPFPALLVRTSYDKQAEWLIDEVADCFTPRGYVLVLQDLRGRHRSEGTGQYFHTVNETAGTDGYDTVEWIAAQPWSNGRVGAMGSSHLALVQTHMALYRPPHLRAIWPDVSPTNSYAHQVRWGGAMQLHMFGALFLHAYDAQEIRDDPPARQRVLQGMERMGDWVRRTPFQQGETPLAAVPNLERTMLDYYRRGAYDEFWRLESNDFEQHFQRHADVPGTYSGGWYDPFAIATTRYYAAMARQNRSPQRLVIGPWTHGGMRAGYSFAGDVDFGSEAAWGRDRYNRERLSWFEGWLKDPPPPPDPSPPVRLFRMGGGSGRKTGEGRLSHGGEWRCENEWPLARTRYQAYYLRCGGGLSPSPPAPGEAPAGFTFDPSRPVPTIAGAMTSIFELAPLGELAQSPWS